MGADLIGYFAVGPRQLDPAKRQAAINEADRRLRWLREASSFLSEPAQADVTQLRDILQRSPYLDPDTDLQSLDRVDREQLIFDIEHLCSIIDDLEAMTGLQAVNRFFPTLDRPPQDWPPVYRDSASIRDPNDLEIPEGQGRLIVFAGERSWGDTPEGAGFRCLARAQVLGLDQTLGIHISPSFMTFRLDLPPRS
ncbi:MAG: hypothetical protein ACE37H_07925 [Phycisphaeraceae bacterium]